MTYVMAHAVPASSTVAVPHGPAGVGGARRRMRSELTRAGAADTAVDDAVLILSELLSNACRHARPIGADGAVRAHWALDARGRITVAVTDGGGPTRPLPASPSVTAHGGRGLAIIRSLAKDWGVDYGAGEVTVWAALPRRAEALYTADLAS
ncbi:ATP-binding protein [Streptomyces polyrhachis]|uniref:ATP-binding protein n=1 Tax=Streptomyces polyrhachis TaxID=1282885 RepID=A0ABW2GF13_9ACTN